MAAADHFDKNHDGSLQPAELHAVTLIYFTDTNAETLHGIGYFYNLQTAQLRLQQAHLARPVQHNTEFVELSCQQVATILMNFCQNVKK